MVSKTEPQKLSDMPSGFVKLRRGLDEHLGRMTGDALKLFVKLLLVAHWRQDEKLGQAEINFSAVAQEFGWCRRRMKYAVAELRHGHYVRILRRGNRYAETLICVEKFDSRGATNSTSTRVEGQKMNGRGAPGGPSSCTSTPVTPFEIKRAAPPKKGLRREEGSSKNGGAPEEKKMFDPTDRLFSPIGKRWERLGIRKLSEKYRPFVEIVDKTRPEPKETIATWCGRIIDLCVNGDVQYPPEFLAVTRRFRKNDKPWFSVAAQIREEQRRRGERNETSQNT